MVRQCKKFIQGLVVACLLLVLTVTPAYSITNPDYTEIYDAFVWENLLESGDILFYVRYDVSYNATLLYNGTPSEDAEDTFQMAFYDDDGVTLIGTRPLEYYQHNIRAMYFTAAQVVDKGLAWGGSYVIKITGNPGLFAPMVEGTNVKTRTLGAGDYLDSDVDPIGTVLLGQAEELQDDWGITLLSSQGRLNSTGSVYFTRAIPNLGSIDYEMFAEIVAVPVIEREDWTRSYEISLKTRQGGTLVNAIADIGDYFGMGESSSEEEQAYDNTGLADGTYDTNTNNYLFQTFSPEAGHDISKVKLLVYRVGSPSTTWVGIKAVDVATGLPTGDDLTWGNFEAGSLTLDPAGQWKKVEVMRHTLTAGYNYTIVIHNVGTASDYVVWRADTTAPIYDRGQGGTGTPFTLVANLDFMFEEYSGGSLGWAALWLVGILYLVTVGVIYGVTKDSSISVIMSFPIVVTAAWLGLGVSMLQVILIVVLVVAIIFAVYFILQRFA